MKTLLFTLVMTAIGSSAHAQMVFEAPPIGFNPKLEVATCYLRSPSGFLFLRRASDSTWAARWGLPGGRVDPGETPTTAAIREVFEETGLALSPSVVHHLGTFYVRDPKRDFVYHSFEACLEDMPSVVLSDEHTEARWMGLEDAVRLPLVPGELECIQCMWGIGTPLCHPGS